MTYQKEEDNVLYRRYAGGDFSAFERLYQRHKGGTYRFFLRQVSNPNDAEDLFQRLWEKVIHQAEKYAPTAKFSTWLYTLARNLLTDNYRHLQVVANVMEESPSEPYEAKSGEKPEQIFDNMINKDALRYCLKKLPSAQLEGFLLREEGALTTQEIADVTGVSLEAAKSRIRNALQNLKQCLALKLGREVA